VGDAGAIAPPPAFVPPRPRARAGETHAGDRIELSEAARQRQRLRADVGDLEETDAARIASLRARVAADAYRPPPDAVAKSLVGELAADLMV
jgi:hypothetical protein